MYKLLKPLGYAALLVLAPVSAIAAEVATFSFGVVPQHAPSKLVRQWQPVLDYLGAKSGLKLRFRTARNIPTFETNLAAGAYDFAYMNPYHYTVFGRAPGYKAFAHQADKHIRGIVVVHKDSPYRKLSDLAGERLAFPSPAAFAASILPRAELARMGVVVDSRFVGSHDSVYHVIARGDYSAGGGIVRTLNTTHNAIRKRLRVLWESKPYTPHAICAHPRVNGETLARLRKAMLEMHTDPRGREALASLRAKGFAAAEDADWDDVRGLGIKLLESLIKQ